MKNTDGASKLHKIIQRLRDRAELYSIAVMPVSDSLIEVQKLTGRSENLTEFAFLIRVQTVNGRETWWPIQYRGADGHTISCETTVNGKTLVNMAKQDSLVELAETWAKTLEAQDVAAKIDTALM
jgi:hypothetical protein